MRKLRELLEQLRQYNQEADVSVIVNNQRKGFSLTFGGGEGATKETCTSVNFYVDELNDDEVEADDEDDYEERDFTDFDPI